MYESEPIRLGATPLEDGSCQFLVWAPKAHQVDVEIVGEQQRLVRLEPGQRGYFSGIVPETPVGTLYSYRLDDGPPRPDPVSRHQPLGVHHHSQVVSPQFAWTDAAWHGIPLSQYVIYELHVGLFSPAGTFVGAIAQLDRLCELGVTAIELMPIAQFPGDRNWGYDGVHPYAAQNSYGGPDGLRQLVDACHERGLAVVLDVVYNHLGPEGNYVSEFGNYFTDRYHTPWGEAVNYDWQQSDEVRRHFIGNAVEWIRDYHIDALRLDAVDTIFDQSPIPFLRQLADAVRREGERSNRRVYTIAESDRNDARHIQPAEIGGFGLSGQWNDEFHHALHALLTGERGGYYLDFGDLASLAKSLRDGYVHTGEYSRYRRRQHGSPTHGVPGERFVVFAQNHDQIGNRAAGDRLSALVSHERTKLAAGFVMLSPFVPLLFMGEEYGDRTPFLYFVSHTDPSLIEAVRRGRKAEFAAFAWKGKLPDPQSPETYERSRPQFALADEAEGPHAQLYRWHQTLLRLRRETPPLAELDRTQSAIELCGERETLVLRRGAGPDQVIAIFCVAAAPQEVTLELARGRWQRLVDSADAEWGGPGSESPAEIVVSPAEEPARLTLSPESVVVYQRQPCSEGTLS